MYPISFLLPIRKERTGRQGLQKNAVLKSVSKSFQTQKMNQLQAQWFKSVEAKFFD
jgi:hypothetical protein